MPCRYDNDENNYSQIAWDANLHKAVVGKSVLIHAFPLNLQLTNTSNTKKVCICKHACTHRDMCTGNKFYGTILTENSYIKHKIHRKEY